MMVAQRIASPSTNLEEAVTRLKRFLQAYAQEETAMPALGPLPPRVLQLGEWFHLSLFEQQVLLLCAAVELDDQVASLLARWGREFPDVGLVLSLFQDGHWDAFGPQAPLRYWRLVEMDTSGRLSSRPLRISERVLHFLLDIEQVDEQLEGFVHPVFEAEPLFPSHAAWAEDLAASLARIEGRLPVVELIGPHPGAKRAVALAVARHLGLQLWEMPAEMLPSTPHDLDLLTRLWQREAALGGCALLLNAEILDKGDRSRTAWVRRFVEATGSVLLVTTAERLEISQRPTLGFEVPGPTPEERRQLWLAALGQTAVRLDGAVEQLATQFHLDPITVETVCSQVDLQQASTQELTSRLWQACRLAARPRIGTLAQRIESQVGWEDLVLPDAQRRLLQVLVAQVRQRFPVYHRWGFAARSNRGLGITALFAGPSGTGKTLAAEVLANVLQLDLYRIDLSQVVSKYIGETEKNLRHVFDAAEGSGAILLFDEADALFGKRSEIKDSHDRYANIEIGYLLQRMESYQGLAILTTNLEKHLDQAFLRRLRFIVRFPFPDATARAEIWRRVFPPETPIQRLDWERLARLNLTGGQIRNIALHAAFLAAEAGTPVGMPHVLEAARIEYIKLERPLTELDFFRK